MTPGLHPPHLRRLVVRPALERLGLWSPVAEDLVLGTALAESAGLRYLRQGLRRLDDARGTARGLWGVEPRTESDLWGNFLRYRPALADRLQSLASTLSSRADDLTWNLAYGAAVARLVYYRAPAPLPPRTAEGLARYHEAHYNTRLGAAGRTPDVLEHLAAFAAVVPGGEFAA